MFARMNPIQRAAQRFAIPRGARQAALAGMAQAAQPQAFGRQRLPAPRGARQPNPSPEERLQQAQQIAVQAQREIAARAGRGGGMMQSLAVPQGAEAALQAGCGDGDCMDIPYGSPFSGFPLEPQPWMQPAALIPIQASFAADLEPLTLQISCGNSLFYGCCARSFNGPGEVNILSAFSGANDADLFCPGSGGLDLNYFNTNGNSCCCEFDWGCFSSFFPLIIEFGVIGVPSGPPLINMAIGGSRLQGGNACGFWPGLFPQVWPGAPGSALPAGGGVAIAA